MNVGYDSAAKDQAKSKEALNWLCILGDLNIGGPGLRNSEGPNSGRPNLGHSDGEKKSEKSYIQKRALGISRCVCACVIKRPSLSSLCTTSCAGSIPHLHTHLE